MIIKLCTRSQTHLELGFVATILHVEFSFYHKNNIGLTVI